ncbi:MAG TPA: cupin domain-containing protein [Solirubrobacteraceae bacterium]|nr:cupin domain-containing protein [Solirubrobacteraceae bacterium]
MSDSTLFAHNSVVALGSAAWADDVPGIRARKLHELGRRWAIVQYAPHARREEWCLDGHAGFVLEGEVEYEFSGEDEAMVVSEGDAFTLATGRGHRGRNTGDSVARLFLIDDPAA